MRSFGLATKLSIAVALLVTVSLGTMSVVTVVASRRSLREQVQSANLVAATLTARAVEQYVADAAGIMGEASGRPKLGAEVRGANWPEVRRVLDNFHRSFTQFDYLFVQDPRGIIRVRVPHAGTVGQDFSFRSFFQDVMRTRRLVISGVYVSRAAQRPVVSIAVPVLDGPDEVKGVIVGALSLAALTRFVATIGQGDPGLVYGVAALARLRDHAYDLIVTDVKMPALDGPGLYREVERRHPGLVSRVIVLTGDLLSPEVTEFLERTGVCSVSKPFTLDEIRRAIQRVLSGA